MDKYDRARGQAKFDEVYCGDLGALPPPGQAPFIDYMLETLFGELWQDETLSVRDKRLLLLGVLVAQGEEGALAIHLRAAVKRGELAVAQLRLLATFPQHGGPRGSRLFQVVTR
jgi:4-carboxymuconolactone decarboxylase